MFTYNIQISVLQGDREVFNTKHSVIMENIPGGDTGGLSGAVSLLKYNNPSTPLCSEERAEENSPHPLFIWC